MKDIILIGLLLIPVIVIVLLEVNSVITYLAICLGEVVSTNLNSNPIVIKLFQHAKYIHNYTYLNNLKLILLLVPLVLVLIIMIRTAKGGIFTINLFGAVATGILLAYLIEPLLPSSLTLAFSSTHLWKEIFNQESNVIGASVLLIIGMVIFQRSKFSHKSSHLKSKNK